MREIRKILLIVTCLFAMGANAQQNNKDVFFTWKQASAVPDADGFAGSYAGVSHGVLIVAGGSNFPGNGRPWNHDAKTWYDKIFVLEKPDGVWREAGKLPRPMGYGVSVTYKDGLLCIGGGDASHNYTDVFMLRYKGKEIGTERLPALPVPLINACGVIIKDVVYIAGGIVTPAAAQTESRVWSLDLSGVGKGGSSGSGASGLVSPGSGSGSWGWKEEPSMPGPSRMLAVAGEQEGNLYVFGGVHLALATGDTAAHREYLRDAWKYTPGKQWSRVADLPYMLAGAPSPAYQAGQSHLVVFGGDDGLNASKLFQLKDEHPGFRQEILAYNCITDVWSVMGGMPVDKKADSAVNPHNSVYAPVTTPLVIWNENVVIAGGEARPAVRSNKVLMATPKQPAGKFGLLDWGVIALYFLAVIGISLWVSRNMGKTTGDFFLGGQKIPWWAAGLSIFGSKLSALTFIAIPAKSYSTDWVYIMNNVMIVAVAPIVTFFYLPYFRKLKLTSVYEYLQIRFNSRVKLLGSFTFVVFQLSRLGVVVYLPSLVLSAVTGMDIFLCILLTTVFTTAYSVVGGIEAVVWTEVMQVFVLMGGALASLFFMSRHTTGGLRGLVHEAYVHDKFNVANLGWSFSEPVLWVVVIGAFLTNLVTYTSDQVVVQRYLTTSTEKEARRSIYTNALLVIPASLIFFGVGTALWVFFRQHPGELNPHGRTDDVFPWFISQQLPAGLSGLVIAGLFAATMSTISSSMNSIATVLTTDFYRHFKKGVSDRKSLRFAKWVTVLLGVLGCLIAMYLVYLHNASIWDQYLKIIGLFGGCLAGMFMAGIFFPRITGSGIFAGFIASSICLYFVQASSKINFFLYPLFAVAGCVIFGYLYSILFPERGEDGLVKTV